MLIPFLNFQPGCFLLISRELRGRAALSEDYSAGRLPASPHHLFDVMMRVAATELNPLSKYIFASRNSQRSAFTYASETERLPDEVTYN
jgi:hypothetical protein